MPTTDFDEFAVAYAADNETNLLNGHYERPAMLDLAGDVTGRRVLDVGCGAGPLSAALRDRGAIVSGFDLSSAMIDLARDRLGDDIDLTVADNHPILYWALNPDADYFDVTAFSYDAEHAGRTVTYTNWHRPLQTMTDAFTAAGFRITSITEPPVSPDTPPALRPENQTHPARFISFIFFTLEAS